MKKICLLLFSAVCLGMSSYSQIVCTNAIYSDTTIYTNGSPNDSIYFICAGETAELIATAPSGAPGWDFQWDSFAPASNAWTALVTENGVVSSTQNVANGGYRVKIFDGTATLVGTYITWVCRVTNTPVVNANTIPAGCGAITLSAVVLNGNITPYYNPPSDTGPVPTLIIDANTVMTICYSGTHTWVSDLAFYLVGPASCGSPTLLLSPNPGAIGQGAVCNSGNNIINLCFSTESPNNLNVCAGAPFSLQGTYGTYGPNATAINWPLIFGCDAAGSGWAVQIYDCIGGDVGALTDATLTFSGLDNLGNPLTVTYSTPPGYSSVISDNSCSPTAASIFQVGNNPIAAVPLAHSFGFQWTADPPFNIPNSSSSLNIPLNPGPTVDTYFTLELTGRNPGAACGGNDIDTELFDYIDPTTSSIIPVEPTYCAQDAAIDLSSDQVGGTWTGTGITSAVDGIFNPASAGAGTWTINYVPSSVCIIGSSIEIEVIDQPIANITPVPALCSSSEPIELTVDIPGGTWSGNGIIDAQNGTFDPSLISDGSATIDYMLDGNCPIAGNILIAVVAQDPLELGTPENILCVYGQAIDLTANVDGGIWSGTGITDPSEGLFDPQLSGPGNFTISYSYNSVCLDQSSIDLEVIDSTLTIDPVATLCLSSNPITLVTSSPGGTWSGQGITNVNVGIFSPSTLSEAGSYMIYYTSNNACNEQDSLLIEVDGVPSLNIIVPAEVCADAQPFLLNTDVSGGIWSGDGIINATTGLFDPSDAGSGPVNITYTISGICIYTDNGTITVNPLPDVSAGDDLAMCYDGSVSLVGSGAQTYLWSPTAGLNSANSATPLATPATTTTYTVTGTSSDGCTASDQAIVTVYQEQDVSVNGPFTICQGDGVQLIATGLASYNWSGGSLSDPNIGDPMASPQSTVNYTVSGLDDNGCNASGSVVVNVIAPESNFTASTLEGMSPLTVTFDNNSVGDDFFWEFGNGNSITTSDVNFSPTQIFTGEDLYTVTLTVSIDECDVSYSLDVYSFYFSQIILIPNVVTIGGDSKNDNFEILSSNMRTLNIQIFDKWGKNVGSIDKPNGQWDPKEYGSGTYYYVLIGEGYDNVKYNRAGYFTALE